MVNRDKLEELLKSSSLQHIEDTISERVGCSLYRDNISLLIGLMEKEVNDSMLSIEDIDRYINTKTEKVIDFGIKILEKYKPQMLSVGIAITYSIYLIYLENMQEHELLEYLKRRRIPKSKQWLQQILTVNKNLEKNKNEVNKG